jgi:hypothetical protein
MVELSQQVVAPVSPPASEAVEFSVSGLLEGSLLDLPDVSLAEVGAERLGEFFGELVEKFEREILCRNSNLRNKIIINTRSPLVMAFMLKMDLNRFSMSAATNKKASPQVLDYLAQKSNSRLREMVACHKNVSIDTLCRLIADKSRPVREAVEVWNGVKILTTDQFVSDRDGRESKTAEVQICEEPPANWQEMVDRQIQAYVEEHGDLPLSNATYVFFVSLFARLPEESAFEQNATHAVAQDSLPEVMKEYLVSQLKVKVPAAPSESQRFIGPVGIFKAKAHDLSRKDFELLVKHRSSPVLASLSDNRSLDPEWLQELVQTCVPIKFVEEPKSYSLDLFNDPELMKALVGLCELFEIDLGVSKGLEASVDDVFSQPEGVLRLQFNILYIRHLVNVFLNLVEREVLKDDEGWIEGGQLKRLWSLSSQNMQQPEHAIDAAALKKGHALLYGHFSKTRKR